MQFIWVTLIAFSIYIAKVYNNNRLISPGLFGPVRNRFAQAGPARPSYYETVHYSPARCSSLWDISKKNSSYFRLWSLWLLLVGSDCMWWVFFFVTFTPGFYEGHCLNRWCIDTNVPFSIFVIKWKSTTSKPVCIGFHTWNRLCILVQRWRSAERKNRTATIPVF